jgi:hypothetical protein
MAADPPVENRRRRDDLVAIYEEPNVRIMEAKALTCSVRRSEPASCRSRRLDQLTEAVDTVRNPPAFRRRESWLVELPRENRRLAPVDHVVCHPSANPVPVSA